MLAVLPAVPGSAPAVLQHGGVHPGPWLSPSAGSGEVLPILVPGSEGWRSRGWGEALAVTALYGAGEFGNKDVLFATLFWGISLQHHGGDLLALCDK